MVTWLSVVSVIETGVEKVDTGVSVNVVVVVECVPEPVGNFVTETPEDWATGDCPFDAVTEALLGTAGLTGGTMLGKFGASGVVGEGSEGCVVGWIGIEAGGKGGFLGGLGFTTTALDEVHGEADDDGNFSGGDTGVGGELDEVTMTTRLEGITSTTEVAGTLEESGGIGCGEDVVEVLVSLVLDVFNVWRVVLGYESLVGVRRVDGVAVGVAGSGTPNTVEFNNAVVAFVAFVWPGQADGSEAFVRDEPGLRIPGEDKVELVGSVPLTM